MRQSDLPLFEYACHEGNYGMDGTLTGARGGREGGGDRWAVGVDWYYHRSG